ncbi:MAG: glycosyltransferase family 2 protein [Candidatus Bathyarchaeota archaeon]|nr:glycosyltransferase family 2 protein [Candidatus Bathyarchaeota archaeon]
MEQKAVAVIIVNWNQKNRLEACLSSLKSRTDYSNYYTIVVDNGSGDGSAERVRQQFGWADLVVLDRNYGFSVGNNQGIVYALKKYNPQYVLLLNNDTEIAQPNWLTKMVDAAQSASDIGVVGCKLVYPDGKTQYLGTKIGVAGLSWINPASEPQCPRAFDVDATLGACFLIKRGVIDKIGFLDVGFSPYVHEESDYCLRAKHAGYRSRILLDAQVTHHWKASIGKVQPAQVEYIVRRNLIRFMLLNYPAKWLLRRVAVEARILFGVFVARNRGGVLPVKLRGGGELLVRLKINLCGWLFNLRRLREILSKRQNRSGWVPPS